MKKLILLLTAFCTTAAQAQYSERWTNASTSSSGARTETFTDGLSSKVNYGSSNPANYYSVGCGYTVLSATDTSENLRFLRTNPDGTVVNVKTGIRFKNNGTPTGKWFNSRGMGICEIKRTKGNGGYIAVGSVGDNINTQAYIVGGVTDALFTRMASSGTCYNSKRIDFNGGDDVFTCVIPSSSDTNKFYACGYSKHGADSNCIIVAIDYNGTILWNHSMRFSDMPGALQSSKAFGLCEVPTSSSTEDIVVCGSIYPTPTVSKGLVFRLNGATGTPVWAKQQALGSPTDNYQKIIYTSNGQLAVCGYSNFTMMSDVWITTMTTAGAVLQSKLILFSDPSNPGSHIPSQAYDLREKNTDLYITGNTNPKTTNMGLMFLKTTASADPIFAIPSYTNQLISDAYGIDIDPSETSNAGIRFFSNTIEGPITSVSSGFAMRTNSSGKTCLSKDSIIPGVNDMTLVTSNDTLYITGDAVKSVAKLTSVNRDCQTQTICFNSAQPLLRNGDDFISDSNPEEDNITLKTFPNPVYGTINIIPGNDMENATIKVLNILGKVVLEQKLISLYKNHSIEMNLASLMPGNYFIIVTTGDKRLTRKIIKQ